MTESEFTKLFITGLIEELSPNFTVLKHSDRFTSGIPDISVSDGTGTTLWIEVKNLEEGARFHQPRKYVDKKLQLHTCKNLGGFYLVNDPHHGGVLMISADELETWLKSVPLPTVPAYGVVSLRPDRLSKVVEFIKEWFVTRV